MHKDVIVITVKRTVDLLAITKIYAVTIKVSMSTAFVYKNIWILVCLESSYMVAKN